MKASILALSLLLGSTAAAQAPSASAVNSAIDRGVKLLLDRQELDGGWAYGGSRRIGNTALILYTLLKSGVDPRHQAIQCAVAHLEGQHPERTYDTSLLLLALCAHDPELHAARIQDLTDLLLSWQAGGGWAYPSGTPDLSNTQYAALGLWAAGNAGADIPARAWNDLISSTLGFAERGSSGYGGGFAYRPGGSATGSMTSAGVGVLAICRSFVSSPGRRLSRKDSSKLDSGIEAGLGWLARNFSVTDNPGVGANHHLYYLYGLERVGALVPAERIGSRDWYAEGAKVLIRAQRSGGSWGGYPDTCFALLFLRRATHPITGGATGQERRYAQAAGKTPVRLAASGDNPIAMWITSFSNVATEALRWEGEKGLRIERVLWRVDGVESARIEGDASSPATDPRFPHRATFDAQGKHTLEAEVHVLAPPAKTSSGRALPPSLRILRSEPLEVRVQHACSEWLLETARDYSRNLLRGVTVSASASSSLGGREASRAVDDNQGTAWIARGDDGEPTLRLVLDKPVDANTIVVGHARQGRSENVPWARALEVEVKINSSPPKRLRMHSNVQRKARLDLGERRRIESLELKIRWRVPGGGGSRDVGLSEIELQLND